MGDDRMFAELMEAKDEPSAAPPPKESVQRQPKRTEPRDSDLPAELQDLTASGYTSHSYRFTEEELRWLRKFCHQVSADLDRPVTHNTLMRLLFRLADGQWKSDPDHNELRALIEALKP